MGFFRFRRSIKILPGVRWNIGKKSTSLSIGARGAHYTVGTAGSRTTVGIPGTGLSYTDIHKSHTQVTQHESYHEVPMPSQEWIRNNKVNVTIHTPDRQPGEAPIRPDQLETLKTFSPDFDLTKVSGFGEIQAECLITQLKEQQKEASKSLLKQFYSQNGHAVPDDFIDHCYDHPGEPLPQKKKGLGFGYLVLIALAIWVLLKMAGIF